MTLYYNAHFWQGGSFDNHIVAVLCQAGKIQSLLYELPLADTDVQWIDLQAAWVYPGSIDTHTHSFEGGLYSLMVDLSSAKTIDAVLELIGAGKGLSKDCIFAWNFDENGISEKRFPTVEELDKVLPDIALVLRRVDGHSCILNSYALQLLAQAGVSIHSSDGTLRGFDNDKAVHWFHHHLSDELVLRAYAAASDIAIAGGFTTIHTMVGDANNSIGHFSLLKKHLADFEVSYILYPQSFNIEAALEAGADRIGGCILADGSIGSGTAALFEPYNGSPERGILYQTDNFWREFITRAHRHNLQVGVHVIGDRAITQINNVYIELANTDYKDLRHQLIHCELTDDALINHIKASGAVPVMQPAFDHLWGGKSGFYAKALGLERSQNMNRYGSFVKNGVKITGSSDWYITPLDINLSLHAAMHHHLEDERLTAGQAVDIYTKNAAWLSHDERNFGAIAVGKKADFTVLNYDVHEDIPLADKKVVKVIKAGKVVYAKDI